MMFYSLMRRNPLKLSGDRSAALDLARGRVLLISGMFALLYFILGIRAFDLGFIQAHNGDYKNNIALVQHSEAKSRGQILDRNGQIVAASLQMASLYSDPKLVANPEKLAQGLSAIFPALAYGKLLQNLQSSKRFVWIKRNITPVEQAAVLELGDPSLAFIYGQKRVYPNKNGVAHLAGYTNIDGQGIAGLELGFNGLLNAGQDVTISLDVRLQHILRRELQDSITTFNAKGGAGVIMDAHTGEVLAGVSLPDFNPHKAGAAKSNQRFNRLMMGVYELGSVFKIFSTAAFLETHNVPMNTTFDARDPIKIGRFTINDYHAESRILTVPEVFMYSSNIGSAMMGQAVGGERLQKFYHDLGLLSALDFEVSEVAKPLTPERWGEIATMTASYGHGIATTPLQVASAVASIVNGGYAVSPTLIKNIAPPSRQKIRIISEETSQKMRQLMRLTVSDGTGGNAFAAGYDVGGKTGTAEKPSAGKYDKAKLISSFAAAFPMEDPRYVIFVAVDEPKGNKQSFNYATAGWVAAPVVANIVKSMAAVLNIAPDNTPDKTINPLKQYVAVKG